MRKALNENPMVQIAVLALVGVAFAFILFTTFLSGSGGDPAAALTETPPAAGSVATTPSQPLAPAANVGGAAAPVSPAAAAPRPDAAAGQDRLAPTEGLPKPIVSAYEADKAIVLLVIDPKSEVSGKIESYTRRLDSRKEVAVFVVKSKRIAEYSRITTGVAVSQTPALVVVRPRKLTGGVPTATVSYGFRSPQSVAQALDDALYKGEPVPSYP